MQGLQEVEIGVIGRGGGAENSNHIGGGGGWGFNRVSGW